MYLGGSKDKEQLESGPVTSTFFFFSAAFPFYCHCFLRSEQHGLDSAPGGHCQGFSAFLNSRCLKALVLHEGTSIIGLQPFRVLSPLDLIPKIKGLVSSAAEVRSAPPGQRVWQQS